MRLMLLVLAWSLLHHLFAGMRYLALDLGLGLEREAARPSALVVIARRGASWSCGGVML